MRREKKIAFALLSALVTLRKSIRRRIRGDKKRDVYFGGDQGARHKSGASLTV